MRLVTCINSIEMRYSQSYKLIVNFLFLNTNSVNVRPQFRVFFCYRTRELLLKPQEVTKHEKTFNDSSINEDVDVIHHQGGHNSRNKNVFVL